MARIRTIKPEIWASVQFMEATLRSRLLFIGLLNFVDDSGRKPWEPRRIKAEIFPGDDVAVVDIEANLEELVKLDLVRRYEVDGATYLYLPTWFRHQVINKPKASILPAPPEEIPVAIPEQSGSVPVLLPECSRNGTVAIPDHSRGKGREGKGMELGREGKGEAASVPDSGRDSGRVDSGRSRMAPPTVEEVQAYAAEAGVEIDAVAFVAFYESNGWRVGKNPMKSWRGAVQTWVRRRAAEAAPKRRDLRSMI